MNDMFISIILTPTGGSLGNEDIYSCNQFQSVPCGTQEDAETDALVRFQGMIDDEEYDPDHTMYKVLTFKLFEEGKIQQTTPKFEYRD